MTTTTLNGFDTVSQAGSGVTWTGLSNMPYPTEGEGAAELTAYNYVSNRLYFSIPHEAVNIPTGARFTEMRLDVKVKKTGTFSGATNVTWSGDTSSSSSTVWSYTQSADETYQTLSLSGDKSYWRLSLSDTAIITYLKSGDLEFSVKGESAAACGLRVKGVVCTITYVKVHGERGAIVATLV